MIRSVGEEGELVVVVELKGGFGVYLDNDSLMELAEGAAVRRRRFADALLRGGDLLFSLTNAAELAGPQGASADATRAFLDTVGPHWTPLELNPRLVVEREAAGSAYPPPVSEHFMQAYLQQRLDDLSPDGSKVLDPFADTFFRLGVVLDWVQADRDSIRAKNVEIYRALGDYLTQLREEYEKDPASLDHALPPLHFDTRWPATFVWNHLLRTLVVKEKSFQFKQNDAPDFCHAVLGAACGSIATLDKKWKRRVEDLPTPNCLAKVYYRPQVDQLVDALEALVASRQ